MIDQEVELVLREIRERIVSRPLTQRQAEAELTENGDGHAPVNTVRPKEEGTGSDALARLHAYPHTTARAWDRLPPIVSNRSGAKARFELWIKARFKSLTRWFTWEQINFNAAVHHSMLDTLQALTDQERSNRQLRTELQELHEKLKSEFREGLQELHATLQKESEAREVDTAQHRIERNAMQAQVRGETEARRMQFENLENQLRLLKEKIEDN